MAQGKNPHLQGYGVTGKSREGKWLELIQNSPDIITIIQLDGTVQYVSPAIERILGYNTEELIGQNAFKLVHPEDVLNFLNIFNRLSQNSDATLSIACRHRRKDGSWCFLESTGSNLLNNTSVEGVVFHSRDITSRQHIVAQLQESARSFRQLAENIQEVFWMFDIRNAKLMYVSPAYEAISGSSCLSLYEQPELFLDAIHPEDRDRVIASLKKQMQGESVEEQYRIVGRDRSIRWIRARGFAIQDESGQVYRICGIGEDITERKQAEEELRQQSWRERLIGVMCERIRHSLNLGEILNTTVAEVRQFLACDRVIIYRFQPDWSGVVVVESVNPEWSSMLTLTIHDTCFAESCIPLYQQGRIYSIENIHTAGLSLCHINLLTQYQIKANLVVPILQDGNQLWGLLAAYHCAGPRRWQPFEQELLSALATQVAIAIQQAQLYRQTQLQAQREQALNQFTRAIRSLLDWETLFATAAQEVSQLLHVDQVEIQQYLPNRQVWRTVADYRQRPNSTNSRGFQVPDVENEIQQTLKQLEVVRIDNTCALNAVSPSIAPDAWLIVPLHFQGHLWGSLCLTIEGRTYHWKDSEVELASAIANHLAIAIQQVQLYHQLSDLNHDLERQVQERTIELQQKIQELQELNILKDDFLSTVSHELRTPLANMTMAIQMLKIAPTADKRQRYLEILQAECNRETDLINDLLDLQRLEVEDHHIPLQESINLKDWLPEIVEPFYARLQERQQTLKLDLAPNLPLLLSDPVGLERILVELLNNACKYTPAGGEIVLRCHHSTPLQSKSNTVPITQLSVSNQAEIPAAALPRIFEKFYRVPHADPWKQGGTGLGLALVQKLVEHLGGTIQVESGNAWTTFTVQFPS